MFKENINDSDLPKCVHLVKRAHICISSAQSENKQKSTMAYPVGKQHYSPLIQLIPINVLDIDRVEDEAYLL